MRTAHKIIFTGPVGAGKTTAVNVLSDIPTVRTERWATDMTRERKQETTVAMDYGRIDLPDGAVIHLYGTPGQERFDFMWEILTQGGLGLVLLLDSTRATPLQDMRFFIQAFRRFIDETALVVGVTQTDIGSTLTPADYQRELHALGFEVIPVFEVDARERRDVTLLIEALLYSIDPMAGS